MQFDVREYKTSLFVHVIHVIRQNPVLKPVCGSVCVPQLSLYFNLCHTLFFTADSFMGGSDTVLYQH